MTVPAPSPRAAGASRGASGGPPTALFQGQTPLAVRMRPTSLDEVAGQDHLLRPGSPLNTLADPDAGSVATSVILWGPPGTGKTTLAQAIARSSGRRFVELSAVTAGVRDVREVMQEALTQRDLYGQSTELIKQHVPMIPVAYGGSAVAYKAAVEGAHASPLTNESFAAVTVE